MISMALIAFAALLTAGCVIVVVCLSVYDALTDSCTALDASEWILASIITCLLCVVGSEVLRAFGL